MLKITLYYLYFSTNGIETRETDNILGKFYFEIYFFNSSDT